MPSSGFVALAVKALLRNNILAKIRRLIFFIFFNNTLLRFIDFSSFRKDRKISNLNIGKVEIKSFPPIILPPQSMDNFNFIFCKLVINHRK